MAYDLPRELLAEVLDNPAILTMTHEQIRMLQDGLANEARYRAEAESHRRAREYPTAPQVISRAQPIQRATEPPRLERRDRRTSNRAHELHRRDQREQHPTIRRRPTETMARRTKENDFDDWGRVILDLLQHDPEFAGMDAHDMLVLQVMELNNATRNRLRGRSSTPETPNENENNDDTLVGGLQRLHFSSSDESEPEPGPEPNVDSDTDDTSPGLDLAEQPPADPIPEGPPPTVSDGAPICTACIEPISSGRWVFTCPCSHMYCSICISGILEAAFSRGRLPADCCQRPIGLSVVRAALSPDRFKLYKSRVEELTAKPEELLYCSRPECAARIILTKVQIEQVKRGRIKAGEKDGLRGTDVVQCRQWGCGTWTCARCKKAEHRGACGRDKEVEELKKLAKEKGMKMCPHCKQLVENTGEGCSVIHCVCGNHFCWKCGKAKPLGGTGYEGSQHGGCDCKILDDHHPHADRANANHRIAHGLPPVPGGLPFVAGDHPELIGHRRVRGPDGQIGFARGVDQPNVRFIDVDIPGPPPRPHNHHHNHHHHHHHRHRMRDIDVFQPIHHHNDIMRQFPVPPGQVGHNRVGNFYRRIVHENEQEQNLSHDG